MTTQSTIDKLIEMRLTSMSDAFRTQMEDPRMKGIPFEEARTAIEKSLGKKIEDCFSSIDEIKHSSLFFESTGINIVILFSFFNNYFYFMGFYNLFS